MAIAYVSGTVERVITGSFGVGLVIAEGYKGKDGQEKITRYTAWFDEDPGTAMGAVVTVSGFLSAKVDEWTGQDGTVRHTAKIALNKAKVSHKEAPLATASTAPDDDLLPF